MKLLFITLFPEFVRENFSHSILGRGRQAGVIEVFFLNPRDFAADKHRTVDDAPCGGGAGRVLKAEPFIAAIREARRELPGAPAVLLSPDGRLFRQPDAQELAGRDALIFVCGHYEGFDERIKEQVDCVYSIGDYVLTGGELPAMVISDAVCRLLPGVLGKQASLADESFTDGLLEYPQYTRPAKADFGDVPQVLLSGNHAEIARWRRKMSLAKTLGARPELLSKARLKDGDSELLRQIVTERASEND
jgi:tRNA (guanine37-N1)-methyltransferase